MTQGKEPHPNCTAKHTKFQPTDDQWKCPKCDKGSDHFWIEESAESADNNCELLHDEDEVGCNNCETGWSGKRVAEQIRKKLGIGMKKCEHCNGKGYLQEGKA